MYAYICIYICLWLRPPPLTSNEVRLTFLLGYFHVVGANSLLYWLVYCSSDETLKKALFFSGASFRAHKAVCFKPLIKFIVTPASSEL